MIVLDAIYVKLHARQNIAEMDQLRFLDAEIAWRFIAWLEFLADTDAWRGNHYHERKREYFYVVRGTLLGRFEDVDTGEFEEQELPEGTVITIEPRLAHAFQGIGYAHCMECSPLEFDASDAFPWVFTPGS